mmetsp:Transcript_27919/g.80466  ORF Transcript_27919/g.80466 Transcript_27919/m.80466 type:complete len:217 (+) Transcript_27919:1135-1785(+)
MQSVQPLPDRGHKLKHFGVKHLEDDHDIKRIWDYAEPGIVGPGKEGLLLLGDPHQSAHLEVKGQAVRGEGPQMGVVEQDADAQGSCALVDPTRALESPQMRLDVPGTLVIEQELLCLLGLALPLAVAPPGVVEGPQGCALGARSWPRVPPRQQDAADHLVVRRHPAGVGPGPQVVLEVGGDKRCAHPLPHRRHIVNVAAQVGPALALDLTHDAGLH